MLMRRMLIATSQNQWLAQRAPRYRFVRKAVQRFMPGEDVSQALDAARALQEKRITTILTQLGENVEDFELIGPQSSCAEWRLGSLLRSRCWHRRGRPRRSRSSSCWPGASS